MHVYRLSGKSEVDIDADTKEEGMRKALDMAKSGAIACVDKSEKEFLVIPFDPVAKRMPNREEERGEVLEQPEDRLNLVDEEKRDKAIGTILACVETLRQHNLPTIAGKIRNALMLLV